MENELLKNVTVTNGQIHKKTQLIRVADVVFIAPVMVYAGVVKSNLSIFIRVTLGLLGVATFFYNLNNLIQVNKIIKELKENSQKNNQQ